jgi:glycolate oxidase iron-sulfur subunit
METSILASLLQTSEGQEADAILRACVHCGFCTATCPTYQLLGDELDGPRGRIYLIKQVLEGKKPSHRTQLHLDRCLTCRACETTCPSGVRYSRLVEIGRNLVEEKVSRPFLQGLKRRLLRKTIPFPGRLSLLLFLGRIARPFLPKGLQRKVPSKQTHSPWPEPIHARRMLVLEGCAQQAATPNTNAATARILHRLGISLISEPTAGCCGAVSQHLAAPDEALDAMRRNIDAWWPHIQSGVEAIIITASGCGATVKEYGDLLRHDGQYADKAKRVAELAKDIIEVLAVEDLSSLKLNNSVGKIAFHSPCSLQHGQQLSGRVEAVLTNLGYRLTPVTDSHLCCGSAGTYSLLQPKLSQQLLQQKLAHLSQAEPQQIVTANIGCQLHLGSATTLPVRHWVELLDEDMSKEKTEG